MTEQASVKQLSTIPLNSINRGYTWQRPWIETMHVKKIEAELAPCPPAPAISVIKTTEVKQLWLTWTPLPNLRFWSSRDGRWDCCDWLGPSPQPPAISVIETLFPTSCDFGHRDTTCETIVTDLALSSQPSSISVIETRHVKQLWLTWPPLLCLLRFQ